MRPDLPPHGGEPLVQVRDLRVSFRLGGHETFEAVRGISFDIPADSTVALVGESGSGKSVTALALLGLLPPENSIVDPASRILFGGKNLVGLPMRELRDLRGADISMIFQEPMTSLNPVFTVGFQLCEVLRLHRGLSAGALVFGATPRGVAPDRTPGASSGPPGANCNKKTAARFPSSDGPAGRTDRTRET